MDAYVKHLTRVNEVQDVTAADDILNSQGQILVKRGARIDNETAARITRFKLLKPLEHSILIENELTSDVLQACFEAYFSSDPSLHFLFTRHDNKKDLKTCCDYIDNFPLVRQKITVLSLLMPTIFEQAMFCAWFSIVLAKRILSNDAANTEMFVAALCHDIGMVHISSTILNKTGALTLDEWKQIQSHPVIGYNIAKETKGLKAIVARAILEHHENLDGTGYPRSCVGSMLSHEGQLLNLLDSVNAVYNKHFKPFKRSLRQVLPIIQMNQHSRFGLAAKHLIMVLKELPEIKPQSIGEDLAIKIIHAVKERNAYISACVDICSDLSNELGFRHDDPAMSGIQNAIIHITMSIAQSGIVNEAYMRWLDQVLKEKLAHAYYEVEEAFLMMQEIIYHIDKLQMQLRISQEKATGGPIQALLTDCANRLEQQPVPKLDTSIAKAWHY